MSRSDRATDFGIAIGKFPQPEICSVLSPLRSPRAVMLPEDKRRFVAKRNDLSTRGAESEFIVLGRQQVGSEAADLNNSAAPNECTVQMGKTRTQKLRIEVRGDELRPKQGCTGNDVARCIILAPQESADDKAGLGPCADSE